MNYVGLVRKGLCAAGCALLIHGASPMATAQENTIEEQTHIHRFENTKRAIYDAFTYVNRIPEKVEEGESPKQLSGRIFGRLANQEGRILLKLPPGMDRADYLAFKTFFRYAGDAQSQMIEDSKIGNCAVCHVPAEFSDSQKYVVTKGGSPTVTPSLRNLMARGIDVAKVLVAKIEASRLKQSGQADDIDDAYAEMNITKEDIPALVSFLELLNDGPDSEFRGLILSSEILDTADLAEVN